MRNAISLGRCAAVAALVLAAGCLRMGGKELTGKFSKLTNEEAANLIRADLEKKRPVSSLTVKLTDGEMTFRGDQNVKTKNISGTVKFKDGQEYALNGQVQPDHLQYFARNDPGASPEFSGYIEAK